MPRYIDADALNTRPRGNNSQRTMWREIKEMVDNAPAADVVPRAEVEKEYGNALQTAFNEGRLDGGKEIAREIFAEIEKLKHTKYDWNDYVEWDAIDELKKKYTGE